MSQTKYDKALEQLRPAMEGKLTEITLTDINVRESASEIKDPDAMGIQLQLCNSNGAELWNWIPGNYTEGVFTSDINQLKAKIEGINSSDVAQCAFNHTAQTAEKSKRKPKDMSM